MKTSTNGKDKPGVPGGIKERGMKSVYFVVPKSIHRRIHSASALMGKSMSEFAVEATVAATEDILTDVTKTCGKILENNPKKA